MNVATHFTSYLIYHNIGEREIRAISGALLNQLFIDQPIPADKLADLVFASDVPVNVVPSVPVLKMAKRHHVQEFFTTGTLRLGTFSYYNRFDHEEIGDTTEGSFVLVGRCPPTTAFAEIAGGFNHYAFCCYGGEADPACLARFGYDACYEIIDVAGFSDAIAKAIGATRWWYSMCEYSKDKVVVGDVNPGFDFKVMSARLLELANTAKYFVKPVTYSHQSEFRFIWQMPSDVDQPLDINCPEAIAYCRRLEHDA